MRGGAGGWGWDCAAAVLSGAAGCREGQRSSWGAGWLHGPADLQQAQRLHLSWALLQPLLLPADGIRAIAKQEEPVGRLLSRLEVAEGLVLDKVGEWVGMGVGVGVEVRCGCGCRRERV